MPNISEIHGDNKDSGYQENNTDNILENSNNLVLVEDPSKKTAAVQAEPSLETSKRTKKLPSLLTKKALEDLQVNIFGINYEFYLIFFTSLKTW